MFLIYVVVVLLIIIVYFNYKSKSHPFWDKQNVDRNHKKIGIISLKKPILTINKNYTIKNLDNFELFRLFINQHFIKGYQYNKSFIDWYLFKSNIFGLYFQDKLIGTIVSKNINLKIIDNNYNCGYVDFLSIMKKYRNQYLAPILISHTINYYSGNQIFIFKKEDKPLPYKYLSKFNYFIKEIDKNPNNLLINIENCNKNNFIHLDKNCKDIELIYKKYLEIATKYKIYLNFINSSCFNNYFTSNNSIFTFYQKKEKEILNIYSFYLTKLVINNKTYNILEIIFFYLPNFMNHLSYYLKKFNISYISIAGLGNYKKITDKYDFSIGKTCFLHLYNFGIKDSYNPTKILLPIP